jgi:hypothetical protein
MSTGAFFNARAAYSPPNPPPMITTCPIAQQYTGGTRFAALQRMANLSNRVARWGGARLSRRLSKSMPIIGAAIAVATVVATMRRKGIIGGAFDTGLNALPGIGAAKNALEVARGRDFFPDRRPLRQGKPEGLRYGASESRIPQP